MVYFCALNIDQQTSLYDPHRRKYETLTDFLECHNRAELRSATRTKLNKKIVSLSGLIMSSQPSCDRWVSEPLSTVRDSNQIVGESY